jgi:Prenyltransferase and squalene oxidase repeat
MLSLARAAYRCLSSEIDRQAQRYRLGSLYTPDARDLDLNRHLREAIGWLMRAQDAGTDRGVAYGVQFGGDFEVSYPETTGYICETLVRLADGCADAQFLRRAREMADWEVAIQLANGAVMAGKFNANPTPAVFNTGMVLLGWAALIARGEPGYEDAARRAADWLLSCQNSDGHFVRGNSQLAAAHATLYNVKAAWGLCEAGVALGDHRYVDAAVRNARYCLFRQHPNGWFPDCCLSDPQAPLLHTLAYTMQGLVGIAKQTGHSDFFAGAQRLADAELRIMGSDGFIPGRQRADFSAPVRWCCLTGSAQTSIVWGELFLRTGDSKYRQAVELVNRYLMSRHDIRNSDPRLRGGLAGSWPVWGEYGRLMVLNWATKFLVDALRIQQRIASR